MPRNPTKARCVVPGCRAWSMRDADRCRAHCTELGLTGGGAPHGSELAKHFESSRSSADPARFSRGNLNALKTGVYASPLPSSALERLAFAIVRRPDDLPKEIARLARSLQARTGDTYLALVALRRTLCQLVPIVADHIYTAELRAALEPLPPAERQRVAANIERLAARLPAEDRLSLLRKKVGTRNNTRNRG